MSIRGFLLLIFFFSFALQAVAQPQGTREKMTLYKQLVTQSAQSPKPTKQLGALNYYINAQVPANYTAAMLLADFEQNKETSCQYLQVITDKNFISQTIQTGDGTDWQILLALAPQIEFKKCAGRVLVQFLLTELNKPYASKESSYEETYFYALIAGSLTVNNYAGHEMLDGLLSLLEGSERDVYGQKVWASIALLESGGPLEGKRNQFEKRLEQLIARFDYMKEETVDNHPISLPVTNQYVAMKLFSYNTSFFNEKTMQDFAVIKTWMLNRNYYLKNPEPGKTGGGEFMDTASGFRHQILENLIYALVTSYKVRNDSLAAEKFVKNALQTNKEGEPKKYFLTAFNGLLAGRQLFNNETLHGWAAYKELETAAASVVQKMEPDLGFSVFVQGGAELAVDWIASGYMLGGVFKAVGAGGKQLFKLVPDPATAKIKVVFQRVGSKVRGGGVAGISLFERNITKALPLSAAIQVSRISLAAQRGILSIGKKQISPRVSEPVLERIKRAVYTRNIVRML